jgi:nucleoside-diphosphate-sugar epimerase
MSLFTVFGASGFIGRHVTAALKAAGHSVLTPARGDAIDPTAGHGHVIYAIGLTGDYRARPYDTIEAHVGIAGRLLQAGHFDSFLYLSSTRVYRGLDPSLAAGEDTPLPLTPSLDGVYDYSKLLGESLCLAHDNPAVRVARLSNVYGDGMSPALFLGALLDSVNKNGGAVIQDHPQSAKDYIAVGAAVEALTAIATRGRQRLYNVASGRRTENRAIADALTAAGQKVSFADTPPQPRIFPQVDVSRLAAEFGAPAGDVARDIPALLKRKS